MARGFWPGDRLAAVSLTYDGTTLNHSAVVVPRLQALGLRATFYAAPEGIVEDLPGWVAVARRGNELGNGAIAREADPSGLMLGWTPEMVLDEVSRTAAFLREMVSVEAESLAYPWGLPRTEDGTDVRVLLSARHPLGRSAQDGFNAPARCDLSYLSAIPAEGFSGDELIRLVEAGAERGAFTVFAFRGVGEGELDASAHDRLVRWLAARGDLWVAPLREVARHVQSRRANHFQVP